MYWEMRVGEDRDNMGWGSRVLRVSRGGELMAGKGKWGKDCVSWGSEESGK